MFTVIARLKSKPGQEAVMAQICRQLARQVKENEKNCLMYIPHVSVKDESEIIFVEKYTGQEAFNAHGQTPYFLEAVGKLQKILAEPLDIKILTEL